MNDTRKPKTSTITEDTRPTRPSRKRDLTLKIQSRIRAGVRGEGR